MSVSRFRTRTSIGRARASLFWLGIVLLASHLTLSLGMETIFPELRDPEYGRKLIRLRQHRETYPDRPLVLVLGSSRAAMGVRPEVIENDPELMSDPTRPMVFNASLVGSGPVMEFLCLRRLIDRGVRPDAVVLEVWPPFLYQEGIFLEEGRLDTNRLYWKDYSLVRQYSSDPKKLAEDHAWARWAPWFSHRFFLLSQIMPGWLKQANRRDFAWDDMNEWGWLPGPVDTDDPTVRQTRIASSFGYYGPMLADWAVSPVSHDAMCSLLSYCQEKDIPVTLIVLPEASEFRDWYASHSRERAEAYLEFLTSTYDTTLIDCRDWIDDARLLDGFHLTRGGAEEYSLRFGREVLPRVRLRGEEP